MLTRRGARTPLAIGAILKNEAPYLLEWVAFHRVVGVSRFFLADNGSDDGTAGLLAALEKIGLVDYIPFPDTPGRAPQLPAYAEILRRFGKNADWIAFIDGDEFLLPSEDVRSIPEILSRMDGDVGVVVANWAVFGSAHQKVATEGLVIERFPMRGDRDLPANRHYKSILRPAAYAGTGNNPHHFRIKEGFRQVHSSGAALTPHVPSRAGLSGEVVWEPLRVNHYVVKSRAEFDRKKMPRGRASVRDMWRDSTFFWSHDRNDFPDPVPDRLLAATRAEIESIRAALARIGFAEELSRIEGSIGSLTPLKPAEDNQNWRGLVERIYVSRGAVHVKGWALTDRNTSAESFSVRIGDRLVEDVALRRHRRPDVVRVFPSADPESGFVLSFALSSVPGEGRASSGIRVKAEDGGESAGLTCTAAWPPEGLGGT